LLGIEEHPIVKKKTKTINLFIRNIFIYNILNQNYHQDS